MSTPPHRHRVVVVGGGFAGLEAVRGLRRAPVDITLVDRRNFHLFQPLLYQVATGALTSAEIASPLRALLKRQRNARVVLGEVSGFDLARRRLLVDDGEIEYDTLVVAAGAAHAYFGRDEWRRFAPGLKSLEDAIEIRRRILTAFEAAELEADPARRRACLTFVVVGGGPTGVEMAGQIAEIARDTLRRDFRSVDPRSARILLVEASGRVLGTFPERLSARAARALERLGVTPVVDRAVVGVSGQAVALARGNGVIERVPARTVVWAAGVRASGLAEALADASGAGLDEAGRVSVGAELTLAGHPEVFALGDMARVHDAHGHAVPLPGVAPVAMQQGRYAAKAIRARLKGREPRAFRYLDKGNVATIGRLKAVADVRGLRLSGTLAWLTWLFVHLYYLVGLQNRVLVFIRWAVSFLTRGRGARLITGEPTAGVAAPREALTARAA
jgi:NADH:ubiquinone reductase (H+-translocating)